MRLEKDLRLTGQFAVEALTGSVKDLSDPHILAHAGRIGAAEQLFQEAVETFGLPLGKMGTVTLPQSHPGLPSGHDQPGDQGQQYQHRRRHAHLVAAHELVRPVS